MKPCYKNTLMVFLCLLFSTISAWVLSQSTDFTWRLADTAQSGQLTIHNSNPSAGNYGLPVDVADLNGDRQLDIIESLIAANSGPARNRLQAGELRIFLDITEVSGLRSQSDGGPFGVPVYGAQAQDLTGMFNAVGDINGDGLTDLVTGAPRSYAGPLRGPGKAYIVFGAQKFPQVIDLASPPSNVVTIDGRTPGDNFGSWVYVGDVNGDGYADVLIGAPGGKGPQDSRPGCGQVYIIYGGQPLPAHIDMRNPGSLRYTVIYGRRVNDHLGGTVFSFDVDGDGYFDILLARGLRPFACVTVDGGDACGGQGEVFVLRGRDDLPSEIDLTTYPHSEYMRFEGKSLGDMLGEDLYVADLDGDGNNDILFGALTASRMGRESAGLAYVLYGPLPFGLDLRMNEPMPNRAFVDGQPVDLQGAVIIGARAHGLFADTLRVGDFNGDGIADLWIGAPRDTPPGLIYVVFSNGRRLPPILDMVNWNVRTPSGPLIATIAGDQPGDALGYNGSSGDFDGTGYYYLVTNAMLSNGLEGRFANAGSVYAVSGAELFQRVQ
jgi:hypothetical protein